MKRRYELPYPENIIKDVLEPTSLLRKDTDNKIRVEILKAFSNLNDKDKTICTLRYVDELTYRKIGEKYAVSGNRIRQLNVRAIYRIRRKLINNGFLEYKSQKYT